jgi:hypothetical protein
MIFLMRGEPSSSFTNSVITTVNSYIIITQAVCAQLLSKIYSVDNRNIYFADMATYKAKYFCLVELAILLTMCRAEQEIEGEILLHVQHSFDLGKTWQDRGTVNIHNTRSGASSHDQVPLLPDQKAALQAQCEVQGLYMVKLTEQKSGSEVGLHRSYTSACSLLEAGLMDLLTLNMDWRGKLMSVALGVQQQPSNINRNSQVRIS